mmetsp:Transcript_10369/g.20855  ORF Transcript_10369/g.20855 Transcript_10369/m.20855 type:complete len:209 (-) Transcript_10369:404-1030(-)
MTIVRTAWPTGGGWHLRGLAALAGGACCLARADIYSRDQTLFVPLQNGSVKSVRIRTGQELQQFYRRVAFGSESCSEEELWTDPRCLRLWSVMSSSLQVLLSRLFQKGLKHQAALRRAAHRRARGARGRALRIAGHTAGGLGGSESAHHRELAAERGPLRACGPSRDVLERERRVATVPLGFSGTLAGALHLVLDVPAGRRASRRRSG